MKLNNLFLSLSTLYLIFLSSKNLLMLGATLLLTALLMTLMVTSLMNSWFALILFLIYVSGMLVLFGYMVAMSPNSKTIFNKYYYMLIFIALIPMKTNYFPLSNQNFEWEVMNMLMNFNCNLYWFITIILLVTLVMVVSMCYKTASPLRPFTNTMQL